jgi:uncharacterized RDD family membrane protein YckC
MLPDERAFLVRGDDSLEYGPVGLDELREWVRENRAGLGTEVRRDEMGASWQPWQSYPELVALLAEVRVTGPAVNLPGELVAAPLGRRMLACVLDLILSYILASPIICAVLIANVPDCQEQLKAMLDDPRIQPSPDLHHYMVICILIWYVMLLLYLAAFHAAHGKTPGKSVLRLRVVDARGGKPALIKTVLRGLVFVLSIYALGIPFACVFLNPQRRAPHDFVAGTWVVRA